jgi:hypothetical protein
MMKNNASFKAGIILIVIGVFLIFRRYHILQFEYLRSFGLFFIGILFLLIGIAQKSSSKLYFSSAMTLLGFYYILDILTIIDAERQLNIAAYTLIIGLSFYPVFILGNRRLNSLLIGNLVTLIGLMFLFWHLEIIKHQFFVRLIDRYWPLIIVIFGIILLISAFQVPGKKTIQSQD